MKSTTARLLVPLVCVGLTVISACAPAPVPESQGPAATKQVGTGMPPAASPVPTPGKTIVVTSTSDSGVGSLRASIREAYSGDTVVFDPVIFPPDAPATIHLVAALPTLERGNITIDGSDAGVIIDGSRIPAARKAHGFTIYSANNRISGLQIVNFAGSGIAILQDASNNTIGGSRLIGAGPLGQGNVIGGNAIGIEIRFSTFGNIVSGNQIGTDQTGTQPLGNFGAGIWLSDGAHDNIIGLDNLIANNGAEGVLVESERSRGNTITQNIISSNARGGIVLTPGAQGGLVPPSRIEIVDLTLGRVTGLTCPGCTVEVFSDASTQAGIYEGMTVADASGIFAFEKGTPLVGPALTVTVTDSQGNTSALSAPVSSSP